MCIRDRTDDALVKACGQASTVCRAPYGAITDEQMSAVGKPFFMWSTDSLDWKLMDADADYNQIMNDSSLGDGSIILMHDIHEPSVKCATEKLIPALIDQGYKLVTVSELAEAKDVTLQSASYSDFWDSSLPVSYTHLQKPWLPLFLQCRFQSVFCADHK